MSRPTSPIPPGRPPTRRGALTPTLIVVALVVVGFIFFANVWTDVLWYRQLGYFEVFVTENLARIGIFLAYILLISLMKDIRRVFQYHGAEHKVIAAHEAGAPATAEAARPFSTVHVRCGTDFLFIVMIMANIRK